MPLKPKILINLPESGLLGYRELIKGILEELKCSPEYGVVMFHHIGDQILKRIEAGEFAGLITEGGFPDGPRGLLGRIPMVGIRHPHPLGRLPRVLENPRTVAGHALRHFQNEHIHSFATFHSLASRHAEGRLRSEAFLNRVREAGLPGVAFPDGPRCADSWSWEGQQADLCDWLHTLPTPCGILCGDDEHAHRILLAAEQIGMQVPGDLAVLGYGDDPFKCRISEPALSSIEPGYGRIGVECVRRLLEEIRGEPRPEQITWMDCNRVIRRASTDRRFSGYPHVKQAVQCLENDLPAVTSARQLAESLRISHTALNQQFRAATGKSTWAYVKSRRMEKAIELLKTTSLTLAEICGETGISGISQLSTDIRNHTGKSPREFRRGFHGESGPAV
ncbi:substrate-binding domain-containing protein [Kiritimatiellaeota bacterium B1221]|nr:substrate-binding domain-containing protein [Kiritimatiellaeota bacterium B1221]